MPRSLAIWACDLWLECTNWTASALNSLVNVRCSFCMIFSLPVSGSLFQVYLPLFSGSRPYTANVLAYYLALVVPDSDGGSFDRCFLSRGQVNAEKPG